VLIFSSYLFFLEFEFTASGIIRKIVPPLCPECGHPMSHNGFNTCKKGLLGEAYVGKYSRRR